jgi:hypothetical protein
MSSATTSPIILVCAALLLLLSWPPLPRPQPPTPSCAVGRATCRVRRETQTRRARDSHVARRTPHVSRVSQRRNGRRRWFPWRRLRPPRARNRTSPCRTAACFSAGSNAKAPWQRCDSPSARLPDGRRPEPSPRVPTGSSTGQTCRPSCGSRMERSSHTGCRKAAPAPTRTTFACRGRRTTERRGANRSCLTAIAPRPNMASRRCSRGTTASG